MSLALVWQAVFSPIAIRGDLAYQYGKTGSLSNIGLTAAQGVLGNAQFGQVNQGINQPGLAEGG